MGSSVGVPRQWSSSDVQKSINAIAPAFEVYGQAFFDNGVDGLALLSIKDSDIDSLGVEIKAIHRDRLLRELEAIRKRLAESVEMPETKVTTIVAPVNQATTNAKATLADSKFNSDVEYFVFGKDDDFRDGLTKKVKKLARSMEIECISNDNGAWSNDYNYVVNTKAVELAIAAHRVRDLGHEGMSLQDFVSHPKAVEAKLTVAEVAALRLYTGPLYDPWNKALRLFSYNPALLVDWSTCISVLYSAIFKLSFLSKKATVYRGVNESQRKLPQSFLQATTHDSFAGGVELGFMSTTVNPCVAIEYAMKGSETVGTIFEIQFDAASRGADVQWVSQYPYEAELLYPPCTYLTCESVRTVSVESLLSAGDRDAAGGVWTAGLQGSVRCVTVRAAVSTARTDVQHLSDCSDWPDHDAFVDYSSNGKELQWTQGVVGFRGYDHSGEWALKLSHECAGMLTCWDYVMLRMMPEKGGFNPNGIWFLIVEDAVVNPTNPRDNITFKLANHGGAYNSEFADLSKVRFTTVKAAEMEPAWLEQNTKLAKKRADTFREKLQQISEQEAAKYVGTWNTGMSNIYDANDRKNFYVHFREPVLPVHNIFHSGDYIMFKNLPVMNRADINDVWFTCDLPGQDTPHFLNPGFKYDIKNGVNYAFFKVLKAGSLTPEQAQENARKINAKLAVHNGTAMTYFTASLFGAR